MHHRRIDDHIDGTTTAYQPLHDPDECDRCSGTGEIVLVLPDGTTTDPKPCTCQTCQPPHDRPKEPPRLFTF